MFNLFSQENMYDEAATQEDMTGERAAAEAKWQERRQNLKKSGRKKWNHGRLPGRYAPEYKNGSIVKSVSNTGISKRYRHSPDIQFHPLKLTAPTQPNRPPYPAPPANPHIP